MKKNKCNPDEMSDRELLIDIHNRVEHLLWRVGLVEKIVFGAIALFLGTLGTLGLGRVFDNANAQPAPVPTEFIENV